MVNIDITTLYNKTAYSAPQISVDPYSVDLWLALERLSVCLLAYTPYAQSHNAKFPQVRDRQLGHSSQSVSSVNRLDWATLLTQLRIARQHCHVGHHGNRSQGILRKLCCCTHYCSKDSSPPTPAASPTSNLPAIPRKVSILPPNIKPARLKPTNDN